MIMMKRIGTVSDVPGQGARTPEEYRAMQARRVAQRAAVVGLRDLRVYEIDHPIEAYIALGVYRVRCTCGEAPSTHPDWRLACCAGCGAVWTNVVVPSPEDRAAIEAVLMKRRRPRDRNWLSAWTIDDLKAQNVAHGEPA